MKRIISTLLICAMLLGSVLIGTVSVSAEGLYTIPDAEQTVVIGNESYQVIRTVEQFETIGHAGGNYILANDLDFSGKEATSLVQLIGTVVLDGNGFALYGYSLSGSGDLATFGVTTGANITLRNLTIGRADAPIRIASASGVTGVSVGSVFGYANATMTLERVTAYVDIHTTNSYAGGLIGNCRGTLNMTDCVCYGDIDNGTATGARGGIIGQVAAALQATISDCSNFANLTYGGYNVGGIAGRVISGKKVIIENCANYAPITTTKYAGGVVGQFQPSEVAVDYTIRNCYNYGNVTGGTQSGGLFGDMGYNKSVTGGQILVSGCYNYGMVKGADDMSGIAGRINSVYPITFESCANLGAVTGSKNTAGLSSSIAMKANTLTVRNFLNLGVITASERGAGGVSGWLSDASTYVFEKCVNLGAIQGTVAGNLFSMTVPTLSVSDSCAYSVLLSASTNKAGYVTGNAAAGIGTVTNVKYVRDSMAQWDTTGCTEQVTMEAAVADLNANFKEVFGGFVLNNDGNGIVPAAPKLAAVQETAVENGVQTVRLIAVLQDSLRYDKVGFAVRIGNGEETRVDGRTVYTQMYTNNSETAKKVNAADFGGKYLYELYVKDVTAVGETVITVTPYGIDLDKSTEYTGQTYRLLYRDGAFVKAERVFEVV